MQRLVSRSLIVLSLLFGSAAAAQSTNTITIKFDDGEGITGELVEVTETGLRLSTLMGIVTIPLDGVSCLGEACPSTVRVIPDGPNVVLTARDGSIELTGELLGVEAGQYVLATNIGEFRIDVAETTCTGTACPRVDTRPTFGGKVILANGPTTIEGVLTGLTDDVYVVQVDVLGTLQVPRNFTCSGDGCPQ